MQTSNIKIIDSIEEFAACAEPWNELAGNRTFHRWEWMFSWWEAFQDQGQLATVVSLDSRQRWNGLAPWYVTASPTRGREVKTLADGNACSDYVSLAIRPGFEKQVTESFADVIAGSLSVSPALNNVDVFQFEGHTANDPTIDALLDHLSQRSVNVETEEMAACWQSALSQSWEEFQQKLHKSFRRKAKKAAKRLHEPDFEATIVDDPHSIEEMWRTFVQLHQQRRAGLGQVGCFADPRFEQFLRRATLRLADQRLARINLVSYQNQPMTANLEFDAGDCVAMYQTGMDPEYLALEPGHINFTMAIQNAIQRGFRQFDFLRGDEPYKSRWNAERISLYRTRIVPRRWKPMLRHGIWSAGKNVKHWSKSIAKQIKS